jgi:hypothetical protein
MLTSPLQPSIRWSFRTQTLAALSFFLLCWWLRLATLHSAFHPDDSPETALAGALPGIQHPPGYPFYTLLSHVACRVLPGTPGFQVALLAAWLGCLCSLGLLVGGIRMIHGAKPWVLAAYAVGCATLPQLWFQGQSAKGGIYTLNLGLTLACLALFWKAKHNRLPWLLPPAVLMLGLGLSNHYMSLLLFSPAFAWWAWHTQPNLKAQLRLLPWLIPGLGFYLYLPLRAAQQPLLNWGDPSTPARLWQVVTRSQYATAANLQHLDNSWKLTLHFLELLPQQLTWPGLLLAVLGIRSLWQKKNLDLRPLLLTLGLHLVVVLWYNNPPQPWVINAFFLPEFALGWMLVLAGATTLPWRWVPPLAVAGVLSMVPSRYAANDFHRDFALYDYSRDLLQGLPRNSTLLASGGNDAFPIWYEQGIYDRRRDVALVDVPLISGWYLKQLRSQVPELDPTWTTRDQVVQGLLTTSRRPLYYTTHNPGDRGIPFGLISQVPMPGQAVNLSVDGLAAPWRTMRLRWMSDATTPMDGNRREFLEYYALSAKALGDFGAKQRVAPLAQFGMTMETKLKMAALR